MGWENSKGFFYFRSMKKLIVLLTVCGLGSGIFAQDAQPYQLFNVKGKKASFKKMARDAAKARVVLFGEFHDDPIAHWLQLKLAQHLHAVRDTLVMGAEMFEQHAQDQLRAFVRGDIEHDEFKETAPALWTNYHTDYRPLAEFARENSVEFIATNVPRYLASAVYRGGFEALDTISDLEKSWLPPLPPKYDPQLPGYQAMLEMGGGHGGENFPKAQAIKDAVMGWHIVQNLPENGTFLHFNGTYHSNNFEGIYWYVQQYEPEIVPFTISMVRQQDLKRLEEEHIGLADYVLVVADDMTRTY